MRIFLSLAFAFCLSSTSAWANQFCVNANVPSTSPTWNQSVALLRFDPTLGTLNSMTITVASTMTGSCGAESLDNSTEQVTLMPSVTVSVRRPDNTVFVSTASATSFMHTFPPFDGTIDFGGTSGATHAGLSILSFTSAPGTPADLALFTGPAGNPGAIMLGVGAVDSSTATATNNPITIFTLQGDATVTLCYDYTPQPNSYCFGDGTSAACPCGNASAVGAGEGCRNSFGIGAKLAATGTASLSNDTFLLTCTGLPATTSALFFQGTVKTNNGNGAVFGDGLRCVSGTVSRLHVQQASGGVASYPGAGQTAVSIAGMVPANATRFYQVWYRNAVAFCTSETFNLSQGVSMMWSP